MNNKIRSLVFRVGIAIIPIVSVGCHQNYLTEPIKPSHVEPCNVEIKPKHSRKQIEDIVKEIKTPKDAFLRISKDIAFQEKHDKIILKCTDRWCSMQETYALSTGDCEDGAILFKSMLSDNPKYHVKIAWLFPKKNKISGHVISVYEEDKKWGYVSFNKNRIHAATFENPSEAINAYNNSFHKPYKSYTFMKFSDEDLKFGKILNQHSGRDPNWINLE